MNQVTYVSSEQNRVKKSQLNNVIQSLNCFVSCTTPDKTEQEYGILEYTGTIKKGQVLYGNKKPKKAGTPVIAGGAWLGNIDKNGRLIITNTCSSTSTISVTEGYCCIQYNAIQDCSSPGSSCYWCGATYLEGCCITCTPGEDEQGPYVCVNSCCTWVTPVHEKCVFSCAFRNVPLFEGNDRLSFRNKIWCPMHSCLCCCNVYYRRPLDCLAAPYCSLPWVGYTCEHAVRGGFYPAGGSTGYRFDGEKLCYDLSYTFNSLDEMVCSINGSAGPFSTEDTVEERGVGCYKGSVGPFLCGFDGSTGKMKWNLNPSTFSLSICPTSNMCYYAGLRWYGAEDHCERYCAYLSNTSACSTSKVNKALVVCANSRKYCTLCVSTKLRPVDCVSIHERYY